MDYALTDPDICIDWLSNNMDYEDFEHALIIDASHIVFDWQNTEMELVDCGE